MSIDETTKIVAAAVAIESSILAMLVAFQTYVRARTEAKLSLLKYFDERDSTIRSWGIEVVRLLDEAISLCDLDPASTQNEAVFDRRLRLLRDLSSSIDIGRWFFPNDVSRSTAHQTHKAAAYRGMRPAILDAIVGGYGILGDINIKSMVGHAASRDALVHQKKLFVAEVQETLDPRRRQVQREEFLR